MNAAAWRLPVQPTLLWSVGLGVLMSIQFLFQPFVWRNWPVDEVLLGWVDIARDRVVVALMIALALVGIGRLPARHLTSRALMLAGAIVAGALIGELILLAGGALEAADHLRLLVARVVRWSAVAGSVAAMFYVWRRVSDARSAAQAVELRRLQIERQIAQARLQVLRSQIEPHFLFNTLATVRRLQHTERAQGSRLLANFLDYLRRTLPALQAERTTLGQEIDLVQAYLGVVEVRMSGRLQTSFAVPAALRACELPPFSIATLVENAVKHGIAPSPLGGMVHVEARRIGDALEVTVADTGVGFSGSAGTGIGLANIRARLRTLYGSGGRLSVESNVPSGVRARMHLPIVVPELAK